MKLSSDRNSFVPKSIVCLRDYNARKFVADLVAGVTVGGPQDDARLATLAAYHHLEAPAH